MTAVIHRYGRVLFAGRCVRAAVAALATVLLLALTALAGAGPARSVLEDKRFRFCHEDRYPLYPSERKWCAHVSKSNTDCPSLSAACEAKVDPKPRMRSWGRSGGGTGKHGKTGAGKDHRKASGTRYRIVLPEILSGIAQVVLVLVLLVAVGLIAVAVMKNSLDGKDTLDSIPPEDSDEVDAAALAEMKRIIETDVDRLLRLAREAAARGDYEAGVELAYAASLRRLEGNALIDMHESRTNGDYVRGLRRTNPDLARALREVTRDVERVQFGSRVADAELFQALLQRVLGIVGRTAAAVLFCLAMGSQLACVEEYSTPVSDEPPTRGGYSPVGSRAVLEMLNDNYFVAKYREGKLDELDSGSDVLIILPGGGPEDDEGWDALFDWASEGGHLLVLAGEVPPKRLLAVEHVLGQAKGAKLFGAGDLTYSSGNLSTVAPVRGAINIESVLVTPLLVREPPVNEVYAAQRELNNGMVMVFADMQLFTNVAMATADNAELLLILLAGHDKVELVDPWIELGAKNPLESVANAKMIPLLLQLAALLVLFLFWKGRAFGTLRDPVEEKRRSFADHVRALGLQYARARASHHALGAYSQWAIERLRDRVPRGKQRNIDELAEMLAARAGMRAQAVVEVLSKAQAASDQAAPRSFRANSTVVPTTVPTPAPVQELQLLRQLNELMAAVSGSSSRNKPSQPARKT